MMTLRRDNIRSPIGLDVGEHSVKAVQLLGRGSSRTLAAAAVLPRAAMSEEPDHPRRLAALTPTEGARLRELLSRRGFTGRNVVIAVPRSAALLSVLDLPPRESGAPLHQIARQELAHAHRLQVETVQAAFWELPRPSQAPEGMSVMAAGCAGEDATAVLDSVESAGFRTLALDVQAWAVARMVEAARESGEPLVAAVDLGWRAASLVLIYRGAVIYERALASGGTRAVIEAVEKAHGLAPEVTEYVLRDIGFEVDTRGQPDDWRLLTKVRTPLEKHFDALARELALAVRYAQHQYPDAATATVLLTGGGAGVPGLASHLSGISGFQTRMVVPADTLTADDTLAAEADSPSLMIAAGLAMWRAEEAACAA